MSPFERFEELKRKRLCFQCLTPGLKAGHGGKCFDKYNCPHTSHRRYQTGLHILICDKHKNEKHQFQFVYTTFGEGRVSPDDTKINKIPLSEVIFFETRNRLRI